jgi:nucleoside phosphorylase
MRHVVILAPMPLEMDAITTAFGLSPTGDRKRDAWSGKLGGTEVTAIHIGMGPPLTRVAASQVLHGPRPVDHMMIAGICGGLDPARPVGTLINPCSLMLHSTGSSFTHHPPGDVPLEGKLITTEGVNLDPVLTRGFFEDGFIAVDMESAAVAEVCEPRGIPWSVYRCIGDRPFDGLLDERLVGLSNPDGSGNMAEIRKLLDAEPDLLPKLEQLGRDASNAARLAAEAAVRGCLALDRQL